MRTVRLVAALAAASLLLVPATAGADLADEQALAERYAPVVRLVAQAQECGYGEPYRPIDVDRLLGEATVALRGSWGRDLVKIAPEAKDLSADRYEYHLDFPGNALDPGCDYERWARRLTGGHPAAVYSHVATDPEHPGKLALQYWLYYVFNDWNNTHEGDWEMLQLVFPAGSAREALDHDPVEVGYSQHEGAERAEWGADKLELVDGTHPVVHPAAGSHANFYEEALHVGSSASEGVGCDDTTGPTYDVRPEVRTIPGDPAQARQAFPWIAFEGRWGELQPAFFNGPTGPNLKERWTEPIAWSQGWRDRSVAVPGGGVLGTGATDFFCDAVAAGSNTLRRMAEDPLPVLVVLGVLLGLVAYLLSRASWTPSAPLRLARRRGWGQVLAAAASLYVRRFPLLVGVGLVFVPVSVVITLLQAAFLSATGAVGLDVTSERRGLLALVVLALSTALTLFGAALVQAATTRALVELDAGRRVGPVGAYRLALGRVRPLLAAVLVAVVAVSLLASSLLLLPIAVWLAVRWALLVPPLELEGLSALRSLRRSGSLVRGRWLKVASITVVGGALVLLAGPLLGALLILLTTAPPPVLNLVAGVVYAVLMPLVALTATYLYFDARVSHELAPEPEPSVLPAEAELA